MTTEREYQEWKNKRQKLSRKTPQGNPVLLWLLGLLILSATLSLKSYRSPYNLPSSPSSSPSTFIREQEI